MLQFTYKLKITERVKAKCERHTRYNPEKDGRAGIRGGCSCCFSLYDLYQARIALDTAQREFIRRATPWTHPRLPRRLKSASEAEPSSETAVRRVRSGGQYHRHPQLPTVHSSTGQFEGSRLSVPN
jgi:hypothetical protein